MTQLRTYQKEAYKAVVKAIENNTSRTSVYAATGAGKTVIFTKAIEHLFNGQDNKKVLVVHPRIALSTDQQERFRQTFDVPFTSFHSGEVIQSTTRESQNNVMNRSTTSRTELEKILEREENHIVFSSYDSLHKIADYKFDLTICDEAHYLVQSQYQEVLDSLQSPVMFFTATPVSTNMDFSMDNIEKFGEVIAKIEPRTLIKQGYLVQPKMFYTKVSTDKKGTYAEFISQIGHTFNEQRAQLDSETIPHKMLVAMPDTQQFDSIMKKVEDLRAIVGDDVDLYYIKAGENKRNGTFIGSRKTALKDFSQSTRPAIILHCDTLAEGIDIDGLTGAYICRGLSQAKFIQTLGRVLRPWKGDFKDSGKPVSFSKREKKYGLVNVAVIDGEIKGSADVSKWFYALQEAGFDDINAILSGTGQEDTTGGTEHFDEEIYQKVLSRITDIQFAEEMKKFEKTTREW